MTPRSPDKAHAFIDAALVIPGYANLYGKSATFDGLLRVLRLFSAADWLSYLSRLQTALAPPRQYSADAIAQTYKGVVGPRTAAALQAFQQRSPKGMRLGLFVERQISTLQQLVIQHAPETADRGFGKPGELDALCDALLITWDLMCPNRDSRKKQEVFASLLQDVARTEGESPERLATRAFHFYQFHRRDPSGPALKLRELFQAATGVSILDYLLGGLVVTVHERKKSPDELAERWEALPAPGERANPTEGRLVETFYRVRSRTLAQIREAIDKWDDKREIAEYSLIGVAKHPVVELHDVGRFTLNLGDLAVSLCDGIRHEIITYALANQTDQLNPQALGREFGALWEEYAHELLSAAFGDRLVPLPEVGDERRADYLIVYPDSVVILELKSGMFLAKRHCSLLSLGERREELKKIDVPKAADQLRATISALRSGEFRDDRVPAYDWTVTPITAVIFSVEPVPLVWGIWEEIAALLSSLDDLGGAGPVTRVRFLSPVDVENLPDLVEVADFGQVLRAWGHDPNQFERPLASYLESQGIEVATNCFKRRYAGVLKIMASKLGLDVSELEF